MEAEELSSGTGRRLSTSSEVGWSGIGRGDSPMGVPSGHLLKPKGMIPLRRRVTIVNFVFSLRLPLISTLI